MSDPMFYALVIDEVLAVGPRASQRVLFQRYSMLATAEEREAFVAALITKAVMQASQLRLQRDKAVP